MNPFGLNRPSVQLNSYWLPPRMKVPLLYYWTSCQTCHYCACRLYNWLGLSMIFLLWLVLSEEATRSVPAQFLQVLFPNCMVSSTIRSFLKFWEANKYNDNSLYCLFGFLATPHPSETAKWLRVMLLQNPWAWFLTPTTTSSQPPVTQALGAPTGLGHLHSHVLLLHRHIIII